jgi:S1-C subfamily serine protease
MTLKTAVDYAVQRYVKVDTQQCAGSGVVIATTCVMTCFHCLHVNSDIHVDGEPAEVIAVDAANDLCLLTCKTVEVDNILLGDAGLGRHVFTVANPMNLSGAILFGQVIWESNKKIVTDIHATSGVSGAGLYNFDGELVGLIHSVMGMKHFGAGYGVATPAELFQKILSTVFHIVAPIADEVQKYGVANEETTEG